jgi:nicotinate-nucleotide adenylyltransferase
MKEIIKTQYGNISYINLLNLKENMKNIALFGGSFNPPHLGHQMMLVYLSNTYNFDEIWVNPVKKHYFEKDKYLIKSFHRVEMAKIAFEKLSEHIKVKNIDINNNFSKTYDTISFLKREKHNKNINITLILGEDNYNSKKQWYKFDKIEEMVNILYLGRCGIKSDLSLPFKFPDISSSRLRENIKENKLFLDKDIFKYILDNNLY